MRSLNNLLIYNMCTCLKNLSADILKAQSENNPQNTIEPIERLEGDGFQHMTFPISDNAIGSSRMYMPFCYRYTFKKVDGTSSKIKKANVSMVFSYCPFCGENLSKDSK